MRPRCGHVTHRIAPSARSVSSLWMFSPVLSPGPKDVSKMYKYVLHDLDVVDIFILNDL